ncbi:sulfite exporter TauE/SafE family protein [Patulibacter sp. NPDC049589]|uniref:sulfite exporter TauE/SafE family protein n=1 Tax=Patulibacter sp. NPDC049589 TaxID=3154731 RepID=UPI00341D7C1A
MLDPLVIAFGLGVGILIGLTGIGGGSLMTPLLVLFAGVPPVMAIGTDLAYGAITKTLGGWRHLRSGTVDLGISRWLAVGSVPGALIGVVLINAVHDRWGEEVDTWLLVGIAAALVVVGLATLYRALFMRAAVARERHTVDLTPRGRAQAVATGLSLGLLVGATSVGSGALIGLVLIFLFRLTPHRVVGTDVFHGAILLWVAGLAHWASGNVDLGLMANILIGSIPGVLIGTHFILRVPANALRPLLACVLLGSALGVLKKAGADVPPAAIIGVPVLVGLLAWWLHRKTTAHADPVLATAPPTARPVSTLRDPDDDGPGVGPSPDPGTADPALALTGNRSSEPVSVAGASATLR